MDSPAKTVDEVVEEIMRIHRSLPPRPGIDEVEGGIILIRNVDNEEQSRLEAIARQKKRKHIPEELFNVLIDMQKHLVHFQSKEQKREAVRLLELENCHHLFDEMIQRASKCCAPSNPSSSSSSSSSSTSTATNINTTSTNNTTQSAASSSSFYRHKEPIKTSDLFTRDDSFVKNSKFGGGFGSSEFSRPQIVDSTLKPHTSGPDGEKLSLIKLASLIEVSSKKGTKDLNLHNKLMDQIEWLPDSIGKLSTLVTLDLSENRLVTLPSSIGGLSSLTKLNLHSNKILELPESIGNLLSLVFINLSANLLSSLPTTFSRLTRLQDLDLSSNNLHVLPDSIGSLISLQKLNIETNNIEEIPHVIGHCLSLKELLADYNKLKALPEAVGRIESLEKLSVRYNIISRLPTTMSSLKNIKQLDVSFNELDSVPESLCFATTLKKINVSNNFADLRSLPRSIGNLENLEELDMGNNQVRVLPDSFRMLSKLRVLNVEGNPLEVPPPDVVDKGAQVVVKYMSDAYEKKDLKVRPIKNKKSWARFLFFSRSNKRKHHGVDYDVLAKVMWFSQNSTRALCVLSANGSVSNVTLQQSATSGGTVMYEGRFESLSLSGSFMVSENGGQPSRTGGLSVALSGLDDHVLGGNVAGLLTAASPVQVIIGRLILANDKQTKRGGANEAEIGSPSESSGGGLGIPLDHHTNPQAMSNINIPWR